MGKGWVRLIVTTNGKPNDTIQNVGVRKVREGKVLALAFANPTCSFAVSGRLDGEIVQCHLRNDRLVGVMSDCDWKILMGDAEASS